MDTTNEFKWQHVMVVDDTAMDRLIAARIIEANKFCDKVVTMESAMDALDYLQQHSNNIEQLPEVIFLDINMPVMTGFDFLDKFSEFPDTIKKYCSIYLLTSSIFPGDLEKANNHPYVKQFISKPLRREKLDEIVP